MSGKVVVNRPMPLDGFISGPGDAMDWIFGFVAPDAAWLAEIAAATAGQCLWRGLVDEILVHVLPVLLGDGIRFSSPGPPRIDLEPLGSTQSGAVTTLRFRVSKPSADHGRGRQ
jgi:hypothetical protein